MITSLTILSSLAIIVTAVIAFAEYQAGKRRHCGGNRRDARDGRRD